MSVLKYFNPPKVEAAWRARSSPQSDAASWIASAACAVDCEEVVVLAAEKRTALRADDGAWWTGQLLLTSFPPRTNQRDPRLRLAPPWIRTGPRGIHADAAHRTNPALVWLIMIRLVIINAEVSRPRLLPLEDPTASRIASPPTGSRNRMDSLLQQAMTTSVEQPVDSSTVEIDIARSARSDERGCDALCSVSVSPNKNINQGNSCTMRRRYFSRSFRTSGKNEVDARTDSDRRKC